MRAKEFIIREAFDPFDPPAFDNPYKNDGADPELWPEPAPKAIPKNTDIVPDQEYLTRESFSIEYANRIGDRIRNECQPFIENNYDALRSGEYLYRGVNSGQTDMIIKGTVRDDRRPRDTPKILHDLLNNFFVKEFNFPYRTSSLFTTPGRGTASEFGIPFIIFPIGEYMLCTSPIVDDLTIDLTSTWVGYPSVMMTKFIKNLDNSEIEQAATNYGLMIPDSIALINALGLFYTFYKPVPLGNWLNFVLNDSIDFYKSFTKLLYNYLYPKLNYHETLIYDPVKPNEIMTRCQQYYGIMSRRPYTNLQPSDDVHNELISNIMNRVLLK